MHLFLGAALPPIVLGEPLEIDFWGLLFDLSLNLGKGEQEKVGALRTYIDVLNVDRLARGEPLDKRGNLDVAALEIGEGLPEVVQGSDRPLRAYLAWAAREYDGFLGEYFAFERDVRRIVAAYRAKRQGGDVAEVLKGEEGDVVSELLAQKESAHFGMPYGFAELEKALARADAGPLEAYQALARYRFERVEEMIQCETFSLDGLLGYAVLVMIAEEWNALLGRNGEQLLRERCG